MTGREYRNMLAIDTATMRLKLALAFGPDRLVKSDNRMERTHGQMIMKKIDELFLSAGLAKKMLDVIVVSRGPGSFTGLRIGLAAAKGISAALGIPVIGVDLFELSAYKLRDVATPVILLLPHRRDEFFTAVVEHGACSMETVKTVPLGDVGKVVSAGQVRLVGVDPAAMSTEAAAAAHAEVLEYDAADLLHVGLRKLAAGGPDDVTRLEPLYLQKSQAEIRFEERRKRK
ncbi:MAG TPA: tRNA (adenosine(37)-N6)-threonylcarbamoyltransferase complex dimerization subunit type 1 TsaB [Acidobacteriota bacterium]|nr:tRNA (adenosine(37)-N6)-threonylcarbamoyltransferase complex dimerization subunit type 1 TsaB [Acidobacteriota bacterium]